jgi:hypothetical protein
VHLPHIDPRARPGGLHGDSACGQSVPDDPHSRDRVGQRAGEHRTEAPAANNAGDAGDVIQMEVSEDQQRDVPNAEIMQAPIHRHRIRPGVDHDRAVTPRRKDERVPLTDVAGHEHPSGRWPRQDGRSHRYLDNDRYQRPHRQQPPQSSSDGERDHGRTQHQQRQGPGNATRPRDGDAVQVPEVVGNPNQPPARPARQLREHRAHRDGERRGHRGDKPQHRGCGHYGLGQHVGGDRDQAQSTRDRDDHRSRHQMCCRPDRDCFRQHGRHPAPAQRVGPARCDHQQRRRGERGHRETGIGRQRRIPQQQTEHCR